MINFDYDKWSDKDRDIFKFLILTNMFVYHKKKKRINILTRYSIKNKKTTRIFFYNLLSYSFLKRFKKLLHLRYLFLIQQIFLFKKSSYSYMKTYIWWKCRPIKFPKLSRRLRKNFFYNEHRFVKNTYIRYSLFNELKIGVVYKALDNRNYKLENCIKCFNKNLKINDVYNNRNSISIMKIWNKSKFLIFAKF